MHLCIQDQHGEKGMKIRGLDMCLYSRFFFLSVYYLKYEVLIEKLKFIDTCSVSSKNQRPVLTSMWTFIVLLYTL